jgi:hypothetical protein
MIIQIQWYRNYYMFILSLVLLIQHFIEQHANKTGILKGKI